MLVGALRPHECMTGLSLKESGCCGAALSALRWTSMISAALSARRCLVCWCSSSDPADHGHQSRRRPTQESGKFSTLLDCCQAVRRPHMSPGVDPESQQRSTVGSRGRIVSFLTSAGGLLTAVAAILTATVAIIGLLVSTEPDVPVADAPPRASDAVPAHQGGQETEPEASMPIRSGPSEIVFQVPNGSGDIDLDSIPPLVATGIGGKDIIIGATTESPSMGTEDSALTLAPLPSDGPDPTEAECASQIETNGTYTSYLSRGARYCVQTAEGRTAYLRVIAAPIGRGTVRLEATVWELPE